MSFAEPFRAIWKSLQLWWDNWFRLLLFGLAWVLCCVTILLGPPATFGFFHSVRQLIAGNEIRWDTYYQGARQYLLASWLWMLANLALAFLIFANYSFYGGLGGSWGWAFQAASLGAGIFWLGIQLYALPYYVLQEKKSLLLAWRNGLFTILATPIFTLVMWAGFAAVLYLHLSMVPLFFGGPALIVLIASVGVEDRLQKFGIREREASKETNKTAGQA